MDGEMDGQLQGHTPVDIVGLYILCVSKGHQRFRGPFYDDGWWSLERENQIENVAARIILFPFPKYK